MRAGLASCPFLDAHSITTTANVPTVTSVGLAKLKAGTTVTVTPKGIIADGKVLMVLKDGVIDSAELEGGATGIAIPPLRNALKALTHEDSTMPPLALAIDPAIPYRTLISVMFSAKQGGFRDFDLVVRAGSDLAMIALSLPEMEPATKGNLAPVGAVPPDPRMVVSITKDKMIVWSLSGLEGTLQKPKLDVAPDHLATCAARSSRSRRDSRRSPTDRSS
jgi:biopolymer transport protein ExbD